MSESDQELANKLNGVIRAYLKKAGFEETNDAFSAECEKMGQLVSLDVGNQTPSETDEFRKELLQYFDEGNKEEFFKRFESLVPSLNLIDNQDFIQLEFHLQIYFIVYLMNSSKESEHHEKEKIEEARQKFKLYLETRSSALSKETDFLPYFALPFIENPNQHLSFTELFKDSWVKNVRDELDLFLTKKFDENKNRFISKEQIDLASLYKNYNNNEEHKILLESYENQLKSKTEDLLKLRENYHNLMRVTVELLAALEIMVKGEEVDLNQVVDICLTAFPDLFRAHQQLNNKDDRVSIGSGSASASEKSLSDKNHNYSMSRPKLYDWNLVHLDYKKLKQDLVSGPLRLKIFILQALRWRLTRSPPGVQRRTVLLDYVANDLLGVQGGIYNSSISQLVMSPIVDLRQSMFRLLNSFASLGIGRSYLAQKSGIVSSTMDSVLFNKLDPVSLDMALAALQKLSLRRQLQTAMIQRDLIEKLITYLADVDSGVLSDYSLEYTVALLMNLSLRSAGKHRCAKQPQKVLKVLTNLLGSQNQDIIPYVNGTLYSLLTNPSIRMEAINMGLEDMLNHFMQESDAEIKRQLEFILKQLTSENPVENTVSDFEDEDDDDEENDVLEEELDIDDNMAIAPGELQGEHLLTTLYLHPSEKGNFKQMEETSLHSGTSRSLDRKMISGGSLQTWTEKSSENDSIEESMSSTVWYPNHKQSLDTVTLESSPKSPLLDHYASHVVTKVIGIEKPLSEAAEFPPVLLRDSTKIGKSVNEYIVAFSSRPKIPRTPEQSPRQSRRSIKYRSSSPLLL